MSDQHVLARRIAHLDMDAFFASVELLHYPHLRGQAVVVGGRSVDAPQQDAQGQWTALRLAQYTGRGVVTTSTYEARALGVFSGMSLMRSARLAPDAILLPAQFDAYRRYSALFKNAVRAIAPDVEDRGIDEIYIDLTDVPGETRELAMRIKAAVHEATGLSCSMAIAPNKLLAKIGSDLDKPDGLTLLDMDSVRERIWPLAVSAINGIGPKATQRLKDNQIETIAELAQTPLASLIALFGSNTGHWMHRVSHGLDDRPVVTHSAPKSLSRETTFARDMDVRQDRQALTQSLESLCDRLAQDLLRKQVMTQTIGIKVRFADFRTVTRDVTVGRATDEVETIVRMARECLRRIEWTGRLRLLGVKASSLVDNAPDSPRQAALPFDFDI